MNKLFVNIKVDREERPDIDAIYMGALHALGQQGGWPLTMFLDSAARPFWGGTYFPKTSQWGRPDFVSVLHQVERIFRTEPEKVANNTDALTAMLSQISGTNPGLELGDTLLRDIARRLSRLVDPVHGGIKGAPKFPQWSTFWLLWRAAIRYADEDAKKAVETTLINICQGGIYDHLRGGFARYSTDERWLAPHFEKMLYDNALLIDLLTHAWRETANPLFRTRITETVGWIEIEMIAGGGGFAASLDADSEGEEGRFYVWTKAEIVEVLGADDAALFSRIYDVTEGGNWEGHTILNRLSSMAPRADEEEAHLALLRGKLLATRARRVRPGWDDKVLADWNGLMIAALARASTVFNEPSWQKMSERAFEFVATRMTTESGRLMHAFRHRLGQAPATAGDYANMVWAAIRLYEATSEKDYLAKATAWTATLDSHYWHPEHGGYAQTADDTADVIVRLRSGHDDATPNANAIMIANLTSLAMLSGEQRFADRAQEIVRAFSGDLTRNLAGHTGLLSATLDLIAPQLVVIAGRELPGGAGLVAALKAVSLPGAVEIAVTAATTAAATQPQCLEGKAPRGGRAAAYACLGPQCSAPVQTAAELTNTLKIQRLLS